jgi:glucose-6-phosphate 1-dehydrogenase
MSEEDFRNRFHDGISCNSENKSIDETSWNTFSEKLHFMSANFSDPADYQRLSSIIEEQEDQWNSPGVRIYYLPVPPGIVEPIINRLGQMGLIRLEEKTRIVFGKPFGNDLESARKLNRILSDHFSETQIYRIDHYQGKETVQNILAFRFANAFFEPRWDRRYIDHVQTTVAEQVNSTRCIRNAAA